jgi:hypothetical protein
MIHLPSNLAIKKPTAKPEQHSLFRIPTDKTGAMHKALSFVHEIKSLLTNISPHAFQLSNLAFSNPIAMVRGEGKKVAVLNLMHKGKSFVHGTIASVPDP